MSAFEANRRASPRLWDTDWLVLRKLGELIEQQLNHVVPAGSRLLDFGCGTMPYRNLVEQRQASYTGADFGTSGAVPIDANGLLPLPDKSFDAVISIQVLEHVRDLDCYLGEARRVLRKNGTLLLSTHGSWLYHPHPEDHRRWTRTGLVHDIEQRGFRVEVIEAIVGPLATTTLIRLSGYCFFLRKIPVIGSALARTLTLVMNARAALEDTLTPTSVRMDNGCVYLTRCIKISA